MIVVSVGDKLRLGAAVVPVLIVSVVDASPIFAVFVVVDGVFTVVVFVELATVLNDVDEGCSKHSLPLR